jgi:lactoylglutathione lyase
MKLLRKNDYRTAVHAGLRRLRRRTRHTCSELTHNWDTESYDLGTGYGHIAIESTMPMPPVSGQGQGWRGHPRGRSDEARQDRDCLRHRPDGYKIEFIQKKEHYSAAD